MSSNNSGKKFLVLGATGMMGGLVARGLLERGENVRALARHAEKAQPLKDIGAVIAIADLDDPSSLTSAFEGIDSVLLVTGNVPNPSVHAMNAINAAKAAGVTHIVRYSVAECTADSDLPLIREHAQTENDVKNSGIPHTILRTHTYMQNLLVSAGTIISDGAIYLPYRDGKVAMVDLRDNADGAIELLVGDLQNSETFTITGPESVSMHDAANAISKAIGKDVNYVDVPPEAAREGMLGVGMDEWLVDLYLGFFEEFASNRFHATSDDFKKLTGREPRSVAEFARDHAALFAGEPAAV